MIKKKYEKKVKTFTFDIDEEELDLDISYLCDKIYSKNNHLNISLTSPLYDYIKKWKLSGKKIKSLLKKYSYIFKGMDKKGLFNTRSELIRFIVILDYLNKNGENLFHTYKFAGQKRKINGKYYDYDSYYNIKAKAIERKLELKKEHINACVLEAKDDIKEVIYCVYKYEKYETLMDNGKNSINIYKEKNQEIICMNNKKYKIIGIA